MALINLFQLYQPQAKRLSNMFVTIIVLSVFVIVALIKGINKNKGTYGSNLEQYIVDHNPQHSGDVERLTAEYHLKVTRGLI